MSFLKKFYHRFVSEKQRIKTRLFLYKITSVFYCGNAFRCNCCEKSFRKFKSKGTILHTRKNSECPYCTSLERTRTLLFYLRNETNIFNHSVRLLHIAPEWILASIFRKSKNIDYISGDINPNYADYQMDITDIPFPDEQFDYIICSHVLGHIPNEKKAVEEMKRVLKPDGTALILTIINPAAPTFETDTANTPEKRLHYYSEPDLLRLHGNDFDKRLLAGGFKKVEAIDYRLQLDPKIREKYALGDGKREIIFKCTK